MRVVIAALALAGCFKPTVSAGDPCEPGNRWCPPPLHCSVVDTCVADDPPAGSDAKTDATSSQSYNYAFVSSSLVNPTTLTAAAADLECQTLAAGKLPGKFSAWLSTASSSSALERLQPVTGGWVRPDHRLFALDVTDLEAGKIRYPLQLDENGIEVGGEAVFTQTDVDGSYLGPDCASASSAMMGTSDGTTTTWTNWLSVPCGTSAHIYCLASDGKAEPPDVIAPAPKLVFLSSFTMDGTFGLAAMDQKCRDEAQHKTTNQNYASFIALAATTASSAVSRLTTGPWGRSDGVIAIDATKNRIAPINLTPDGLYLDVEAWGGAITLTTVASGNPQDCTDWTSGIGLYGRSSRASSTAFGYSMGACTSPRHVFCVEP